jgi:hypothetical protein
MGWRTPRSDRRSFGGSRSQRFGWLEPATPQAEAEAAAQPEQRSGQGRIRSSAKHQEIREAQRAGASAGQIKALLKRLEALAAELGEGTSLDWSVRFEPSQRTLCLRWRQRRCDGSSEPPPWQTQRFGGRGSDTPAPRNSNRRGFG